MGSDFSKNMMSEFPKNVYLPQLMKDAMNSHDVDQKKTQKLWKRTYIYFTHQQLHGLNLQHSAVADLEI